MYLNKEQLDELIRFASDDKAFPSFEALEALNALYTAVQRNTVRHLSGTRKRNAMLEEQVQRLREKREQKIDDGQFAETDLDSAEVATGLLFQLQQLKTYKLNKYKLQAILYEMYASWLYSKKERLFLEHPVATQFGPRFWRVYNRVDTNNTVPYQAWKAFAEKNPAVAAFCKNAAAKYYDYAEGTLNRTFLASKAYKNADESHNNGKWNKDIEDSDIYRWKENQKAQKEN